MVFAGAKLPQRGERGRQMSGNSVDRRIANGKNGHREACSGIRTFLPFENFTIFDHVSLFH
jgi:hypothetical protein